MKKSILPLATVALLAAGSAFAAVESGDTATGFFRWTGQVLPNNVSNGLVILPAPGSAPHDKGLLFFDNTDDKITLTGSDVLSFQVFEEDSANEGTAVPNTPALGADQYTYELQKLTVNAGVVMDNEVPTDTVGAKIFDIMANDTTYLVGAENATQGAEIVNLKVVQANLADDLEDHGIEENATVSVIAAILVKETITEL